MDATHSLFSFGMMALSAIAGYLLFRKNPRQTIAMRGPLFITGFLVFFYLGLANLPLALPGIFGRLLGHSVWADYMPASRMNVPQQGGTWWLVRWLDPIRDGYFYALLLGIVWAIVNLIRRHDWRWNVVCVAIGVVVLSTHLLISMTCFLFCF
jgi:hypothetical protein